MDSRNWSDRRVGEVFHGVAEGILLPHALRVAEADELVFRGCQCRVDVIALPPSFSLSADLSSDTSFCHELSHQFDGSVLGSPISDNYLKLVEGIIAL